MKRGVEIVMNTIESLEKKIDRWEEMSASGDKPMPHGRERFLNRNTLSAPTVSQHFIPMQQEISRLRQELKEAAFIMSELLTLEEVRNILKTK